MTAPRPRLTPEREERARVQARLYPDGITAALLNEIDALREQLGGWIIVGTPPKVPTAHRPDPPTPVAP